MTFRIRAARANDLQPLYEMAKLTGGGFTNLPPDRKALTAKLARAAEAYGNIGAGDPKNPSDELFVFVLENVETGEVRGTSQIFTSVGRKWPFYSYRMATLTQHSKELNRTFRAEMLNLVTDLEGSSEVGGLFLHPNERAGGLGMLLARSRYLFIAMHRERFGARTIAELRGVHDETGNSAFWEGLAGKFFGMTFREADEFNAVRGNQFIADLIPKHPIYTALLPESARAVIGQPHHSGRAAMRMLEKEGFVYEHYIDIFDGGPTVVAQTDSIATVRDARTAPVVAIGASDGAVESLVACGRLGAFRATVGEVAAVAGGWRVDEAAANALGLAVGADVTVVPR